MTNTTPIFWEASGVSLHNYAWSITTKAGTRNSVPERRGENFQFPFRVGQIRTKKYRDQRVLDLDMWVTDCDMDGAVSGNRAAREEKLQDNWDTLMGLFDTEGEFPLKKRWYDGGTIKSATAKAELVEPPEASLLADNTYGFTVSLALADPYFYVPVANQAIGTITVQGDSPTDHLVLSIPNGRVTSPDGNWIQYNGTGTAIIDVSACTAKKDGQYVNGLITRNPIFPEWMRLSPGVNALVGTGTIAYEAAWK